MAEKKPKAEVFKTPRGVLVGFTALNKPNTKYKDAGEYKGAIAIAADHPWAVDMIQKIDAKIAEAFKAKVENDDRKPGDIKKKPWKLNDSKPYDNELDPDTAEETGRVIFKFGKVASGVYKSGPKKGEKWTSKVDFFDGKGQKLTNVDPWKGSEVVMKFIMGDYAVSPEVGVGVSLKPTVCQIIKLVAGGGGEDGSDLDSYDDADEIESGTEAAKPDAPAADSGEKSTGNVADTSNDADDF